jgi:hypothetical protein
MLALKNECMNEETQGESWYYTGIKAFKTFINGII